GVCMGPPQWLDGSIRLDEGRRFLAESQTMMTSLPALMTNLRLLGIRLLLVGCGFALAGCASGNGLWVELGEQRYAVEVADDDAESARGLMFRDALAPDRGMLFVHEHEEPQAYWMKKTRTRLDLLL